MSPNATMAVNPSFSKEGFVTGAGSEPEDADDFVPNSGTVLEAAFVDPAYAGNGSSSVDLQAPPSKLLTSSGVSNPSVRTRETVTTSRCGLLQCCKNTEEQVVVKPYSELSPNEKAILHSSTTKMSEKDRARMIRAQEKAMRQAQRDRERYNDVPDGLLIYRLDTHAHAISLVSAPSAKTNEKTLLMHMIVASAMPGPERTRKTIILTGVDGTRAVLTACEQRTAISWLEAIEMMLGNTGKGRSFFGRKVRRLQSFMFCKQRTNARKAIMSNSLTHRPELYMCIYTFFPPFLPFTFATFRVTRVGRRKTWETKSAIRLRTGT